MGACHSCHPIAIPAQDSLQPECCRSRKLQEQTFLMVGITSDRWTQRRSDRRDNSGSHWPTSKVQKEYDNQRRFQPHGYPPTNPNSSDSSPRWRNEQQGVIRKRRWQNHAPNKAAPYEWSNTHGQEEHREADASNDKESEHWRRDDDWSQYGWWHPSKRSKISVKMKRHVYNAHGCAPPYRGSYLTATDFVELDASRSLQEQIHIISDQGHDAQLASFPTDVDAPRRWELSSPGWQLVTDLTKTVQEVFGSNKAVVVLMPMIGTD